LLPHLGSGELRIALAHSEPDVRYELDTVRATTAKATADGYILRGVKTLVFDAPTADQLIVSAALVGGSFGLFIVPVQASGVTMSAYPLIDGTRAADIVFNDVRVPKTALLQRFGDTDFHVSRYLTKGQI
jgi:alkylation response protein AidB-like acyl-CoA dehydrogenase